MAQHDYIISNQTFPNTRADLNNVLQAIATCNKGSSAPTTQYAGQMWIDDSAGTTWTLYLYDGSDNIQVATIDTTANTINFIDSVVTGFDIVTDTTPQLGGDLDLNSNDITGTGNIDISGNVTQTNSVGSSTLTIDGSSPNDSSIFLNDAGSNSYSLFKDGSQSDDLRIISYGDTAGNTDILRYSKNGSLKFQTGATDRATIDSSGRLLVGTTNITPASSNVNGFVVSNSQIGASRDGTVAEINRISTDGTLVNFRKDGTTVGSIGASFSRPYFANDSIGIKLGSTTDLRPTNSSGTNNDNAIDLGVSSVRFRNLYLGAGAVISEQTLTDGATISWDVSTKSVAKVTLGGNRTISAPSNALNTGQFISLLVIQDGTGSRTLTWNAVYEFASDTAPTLTTTGGKGDLFVFRYNGTKWLEVGRNLNLTLS